MLKYEAKMHQFVMDPGYGRFLIFDGIRFEWEFQQNSLLETKLVLAQQLKLKWLIIKLKIPWKLIL